MSICRLEQNKSGESSEAIRNLVLMIASLSMCGYTELRPSPASVSSLFQMLGFTLPQPQGRGMCYIVCTCIFLYNEKLVSQFDKYHFNCFGDDVEKLLDHCSSFSNQIILLC